MASLASHRKPMICASEERFFTSSLLLVGDWTRNRAATQIRGDVAPAPSHNHRLQRRTRGCFPSEHVRFFDAGRRPLKQLREQNWRNEQLARDCS